MSAKRTAILLVIILSIACSSSTGPALDPYSFVGEWTLLIDSTSDCWPSTVFYFTIGAEDADGYSATAPAMNIGSGWGLAADDADHYPLIGHLDLADMDFVLNFWLQAPTIGFPFTGILESPELLSGRIESKSVPTCMSEAAASQNH